MAEVNEALQTDIAVGTYRKGLFNFGNYTLRSGMWSPYYIDLRPIPSISEPLEDGDMSRSDQLKYRKDVVEGYSTILDDLKYDHLQAIPEAVVALTAMIGFARDDSVLYRRVQSKEHGVGRAGILGDYSPGGQVVLLDDLITTSGAKVEEKKLVEEISREIDTEGNIIGEGLNIEHAVILLDREQDNAVQKARDAGLIIHSVLTFTKLIKIIRAEGLLDERSYEIIQGYNAGTIKKPEDIA